MLSFNKKIWKRRLLPKFNFIIAGFLAFCCKYQNIIIQIIENGDELCGLLQPVIDHIKPWSDIIAKLFE